MGYSLVLKESWGAISLSLKHVYSFFFVGVALVCFGSGYYHLNPSNTTLLRDRLPMTLALMNRRADDFDADTVTADFKMNKLAND